MKCLVDTKRHIEGMTSKLTNGSVLQEMASMKAEVADVNRRLLHVHHLEEKCERLEEKCQSLEDKCENQERKIQSLEARCDLLMRTGAMLIKNEEWYYSAPYIDASHWTDRGFDRPYRVRMRKFLNNIRRATSSLRSGVVGNREISLGEELGDEEGGLLYVTRFFLIGPSSRVHSRFPKLVTTVSWLAVTAFLSVGYNCPVR